MTRAFSRWLVVLLGLCATMLAGRAAASPLFETLGGVGDRGGWNARIVGSSAASAYFNPALLTRSGSDFEAGVFFLNDSISLDLDGRGAVDVPMAYRGATHADGSVFAEPSLPTAWLRDGCVPPQCRPALLARPRQAAGSSGRTHAYQVVGLVTPLLGPRLVFGFYGVIPLGEFTSAHSFFADEREQFFTNSLHPELYADRLSSTSLALGLGSQLWKQLSIGVSFTLALHNNTRSSSFVGNSDALDRTLVVSNDIGVEAAFAPHLGIDYAPIEGLHFAATAHSPEKFDIATGISTLLPNGNQQTASRTEVHDYMPWRFALGASVDVISDGSELPVNAHELTLCASAIFNTWSRYLDRQGARPSAPYTWANTFSYALGARHSFGRMRSFVDLEYVPTPVPAQTGRTNYVDNDRVGASAGIDVQFELFALRWRVGLQAQAQALLSRYQQKLDPTAAGNTNRAGLVRDEFPDDAVDSRGDPIPSAQGLQTNNPGWPGFSSKGMLIGGGVNVALLL